MEKISLSVEGINLYILYIMEVICMSLRKRKVYIICAGLIIILGLSFVLLENKVRQNRNLLNSQSETNDISTSKKVRLSVCIPQDAWAGEALDPTLINSVKTEMEAANNIEIELIAPLSNNYSKNLQDMVADGDIPDVYILRKAMNNLQLYSVNGYAKDITSLVEKNTNINNTINKTYIDYTRVDGKIYGVPRSKPMSKVLWLRKDILQKYGVTLSETPTTDEFFTEMKKLADTNIIPFSFPKFIDNLTFFYNAFNTCGGIGKDSNGLYYDGFNTPETKQALTYIKTLYNEGILDSEFATNENSVIRDKLTSGSAASNIDYFNRYIDYMSEGTAKNSEFDLQPVYMLKGPKGGSGNLNESIQNVYVVSPNCKNPEAAVSFISWMATSEESAKMQLVGIKDKHYTVENGVIKATEAAKASGYKTTATNLLLTNTQIKNFGFKWDSMTEKFLPKQKVIANDNLKYLGPTIIIPGETSELYDKNALAYKEKIEKLTYKIITGADSIENCYKEYEEFWKNINGDQMIDELNKNHL